MNKLTQQERTKLKEILSELEILKYVGNLDFMGLENHEGFKVNETINNRLEIPIKYLKEVLKWITNLKNIMR